jgi:hypothetical protein
VFLEKSQREEGNSENEGKSEEIRKTDFSLCPDKKIQNIDNLKENCTWGLVDPNDSRIVRPRERVRNEGRAVG